MRSLAFVFLALVACSTKTETISKDPSTDKSPTERAGDSTVSGSRIKAKVLTAEDGTKTNYGFHDTQRDEDCSFQQVDGRYRCLPTTTATVRVDLFTDSACKKGIAVATKGCAKPKVASRQEDYCPTTGYTTSKFYGVGVRVTSAIIYSKNETSGECTQADSTSYSTASDLYTLSDAISLDEFVAADIAAE
jgi:hypothetical protein